MRKLDRHAAGTVGVSFSEDLAYCLYARDAWGIRTPTASRIPACTSAAVLGENGRQATKTGDLGTGWDRWWQATLGAYVGGSGYEARQLGSLPDEFADTDVRQAFRALYPEAREWVMQSKREHIQLIQLTHTIRMRTAVLDLRPGDFHIVCIPVESSFGQLISPSYALASPVLFGDQPSFLDWLSTVSTAS